MCVCVCVSVSVCVCVLQSQQPSKAPIDVIDVISSDEENIIAHDLAPASARTTTQQQVQEPAAPAAPPAKVGGRALPSSFTRGTSQANTQKTQGRAWGKAR